MDNKKNLPMNESMFSAIDQIRQDSKDVRDFVKNVFADREFKKMSNDKDFIKYLKSIYEGTMIDEEHVKFSNRTQNGTISTGSVQTTNESLNENKYSIIDPKGNVAGTGTKDQTNRKAKTLGGSKKGYFVVPVHRAKEARRAMERFKFNFKNAKLKDKMSGLYFDDEMFDESVNEAEIKWNAVDNAIVRYIKQNVKVLEKPIKARDEAGTKKMLKGFIDGLVNAQRSLKLESVNEASKEAMGIAGFTGTRGIAVQKFIDDYNLDSKKLFNFVKKGKLKDRLAFVTAIAGKPGNKHQGDIVGMFGESTDGVPQGYNPMVEDTQEIKNLLKKVGNKETKFYDVLNAMEKKYGKNKYRIWLEKSLKDFGVNPKHYDYRTNAGAEEKLFQLGK